FRKVTHQPKAESSLQVRKPEAVLPQSVAVVCPARGGNLTVAGLVKGPTGAEWQASGGDLRLRIPAGKEPLRFTLWLARAEWEADVNALLAAAVIPQPDRDLAPLTRGGPPRWPVALTTQARVGKDDGPFAVDVLTHPENNPWFCQTRYTGLD